MKKNHMEKYMEQSLRLKKLANKSKLTIAIITVVVAAIWLPLTAFFPTDNTAFWIIAELIVLTIVVIIVSKQAEKVKKYNAEFRKNNDKYGITTEDLKKYKKNRGY